MGRNCIVVDGFSTGRFLPEELAKFGFSTYHVLSTKEISSFFSATYLPKLFDGEFVLEEIDIEQLLDDLQPEFVVAGSEKGVLVADVIANKLGLRANDPAKSAARRDKGALATVLQEAGLRAIDGIKSDRADEICNWMTDRGYREIVLKPLDSGGTEDVTFCTTSADVHVAAGRILGKKNVTGSFNQKLIAQERIRGDQFTVNAVCCQGHFFVGEVWTYETQDVKGAGSICSHEWFLEGRNPISVELETYLKAASRALSVVEGPIHAEIIVDEKGPVLVDFAARMQGAMSPHATLVAAGHNHITLTAQSYAEPTAFLEYRRVNRPYKRKSQSLCVSLISDKSGKIRGVPGLDRIRALPTFCDAIAFPPVGANLTPTRDLGSTPGIIYLAADNADALRRDYDRIRAMRMEEIFDLSTAVPSAAGAV